MLNDLFSTYMHHKLMQMHLYHFMLLCTCKSIFQNITVISSLAFDFIPEFTYNYVSGTLFKKKKTKKKKNYVSE